MYAIVRCGGKQYQVAVGDRIRVEKLAGDTGDLVDISEVLLVAAEDGVEVGRPTVEGATVKARILEQDKAKKVLVFKKKRRKGYRVKRGHRQPYTALEVQEIAR